jgi:hypothetical protein
MKTKIISLLISLSFSLYCVGCSVPSYLSLGSEKAQKLAIEPETNSKTIVHPVTHPVPAQHGEYSGKPEDATQISTENFLVHQVHQGQVNALAVTKNGLQAYSGGQDGQVVQSTIIETPVSGNDSQRAELSPAQLPGRFIQTQTILVGRKPILALSLSPDEKKLVVSQFSSVIVFDLEKREITNKLSQVEGRVLSLAWDPKGQLVLLGRANGDIFAWNLVAGPDAGEDSVDALERYEGSNSPIVRLLFHPSGRAFFAAERNGGIYLWRLLRTESDLGIRDEQAVVDEDKTGRLKKVIAVLRSEVEDIWLDNTASTVFAAAVDGSLYRFKVRGAKELDKITVGVGAIFSVEGLTLQDGAGGGTKIDIVATSGKEQRIKFWCQSGIIAQSVLFRNPPTILRAGKTAPILWAGEKTGNLLTFDADLLVKSPTWSERVVLCKPSPLEF